MQPQGCTTAGRRCECGTRQQVGPASTVALWRPSANIKTYALQLTRLPYPNTQIPPSNSGCSVEGSLGWGGWGIVMAASPLALVPSRRASWAQLQCLRVIKQWEGRSGAQFCSNEHRTRSRPGTAKNNDQHRDIPSSPLLKTRQCVCPEGAAGRRSQLYSNVGCALWVLGGSGVCMDVPAPSQGREGESRSKHRSSSGGKQISAVLPDGAA